MTHFEEVAQKEEARLIEIRTLGMSIDEARKFIIKNPSFEIEAPLNYVLGQLAEIQDCFQTNRQFDAQKQLNRLRMALVENFTIIKTFPSTPTKL